MKTLSRRGMSASKLLGALVILLAGAFGFYHYANVRTAAAKRAVTINRMMALEDALRRYSLDSGGTLPTQRQSLRALVEAPSLAPRPVVWRGPYVSSVAVLQDGWGRPFHYFAAGGFIKHGSSVRRPFDLASYGRDGAEGGAGLDRDLLSWDRTTMTP